MKNFLLQFHLKGISKMDSIKDNFSDFSNTLLFPGSNHPNICLPMEARPESGISLGDTEEVRGQIYSHPDFQVFYSMSCGCNYIFCLYSLGWLHGLATM